LRKLKEILKYISMRTNYLTMPLGALSFAGERIHYSQHTPRMSIARNLRGPSSSRTPSTRSRGLPCPWRRKI
jgi:hypothetical protein